MKMLGLNPTEQEVVDIPNNIARWVLNFTKYSFEDKVVGRKGLIYFPDFCQLVLDRLREDEVQEEQFRQNMFKVGKRL